ncbi:ATPase involved in chromosome partitioning, ParA/MinD family, Soj homolog [Thermococcus kodakarensis KOD1]|uniref:ATPase involved in chromosome partitioning, ParA/MinD family, Soj homolog n=1 Tax=Thermococcus kodakarensis (strain ATCC BAA-918 / JCM 12380 / KOD1) TaxID=69014 RepID=Q5JHT6_THEKO|nr:ParA family protein [Thermococcus kodakarensis]WCN28097.1 ParA family protein [Thermococcus kodakarensis]WCN30394.1 ParA family protein [Thermococcus kodakarensis]BAD86461.1 ATPase involved in chromosome partitioning, ParA/MinD family, Soj homolog [Thermococcus kodakarensis KOD1]
MAVVISVANQKGGVGKTTLTMNLGFALSEMGKRVLLVDVDPQFNLTFGLIGMKVLEHSSRNVGTLMTRESEIEETIVPVKENLDLIPSHLNLSAKEIEIINAYNRERRLEKALIPVLPDYDYVLIDNPPSMGIFLVNSLTASDYVLIPLELSYFGVIGMQLMFNLMRMIREETNENLKLLGLVPNKFTKQTKVPKMRLKELKEAYPDAPILTTIPKAIALEKAQSEGKSIFEFEPNGRASKAFQKLAKEVVEIVEG